MVVDFADIKQIVQKSVIEKYDHAFLYWEQDKVIRPFAKANPDLKLVAVPFIPTAECIVTRIAADLQVDMSEQMPDVTLSRLELFESPTSQAIWTNTSEIRSR